FHMNNTGFVYKETDSKSLSLAPFYRYDKDAGKSVLLDDEHEYDKKVASGGGGLYSTTSDYMKFLDRLMSDSSKTKLYVNQLPEEVTKIPEGIYPNSGYGYGVAVKLSTDESYLPKGSFYWAGLGGTIFWVDPVNNIKVVAMMQMAGGRKSMEKKIIPLIYKAIQSQ
ncbi:MAG: serine hydrolase, partial [Bacteroidota bacterium]